jgi:hypothetical protein
VLADEIAKIVKDEFDLELQADEGWDLACVARMVQPPLDRFPKLAELLDDMREVAKNLREAESALKRLRDRTRRSWPKAPTTTYEEHLGLLRRILKDYDAPRTKPGRPEKRWVEAATTLRIFLERMRRKREPDGREPRANLPWNVCIARILSLVDVQVKAATVAKKLSEARAETGMGREL